jgi:hypothetical protein
MFKKYALHPKIILTGVIILAVLLSTNIYFVNKYYNTFSLTTLVLAKDIEINGYLKDKPFNITGTWQNDANFRANRLAPPIILFMLSKITNIDIFIIKFLPIGGFILSFVALILAKEFVKYSIKNRNNIMMTTIVSLYVIFLTATPQIIEKTDYSQFSLGFIYYIFFLILVIKMLHNNYKIIILPLVLFIIALNQSYYSTEFLALSTIFGLLVSFIIYSLYKRSYRNTNYIKVLTLMIITVIIFINFEPLVINYPRSNPNMFDKAVSTLKSYVTEVFNYFSKEDVPARLTYENPMVLRLDSLIKATLITLIISYLVNIMINRNKESYAITALSLAIIITSFIEFLLYATTETVGGFRYLIMFGSLISIYIAFMGSSRLFSQNNIISLSLRYSLISLVILLITSNSIRYILIFNDSDKEDYRKYINGLDFTIRTTNDGSRVVSTHHVSALLFGYSTHYNKQYTVSIDQLAGMVHYLDNPKLFCSVAITQDIDLFIALHNFATRPIYGDLWIRESTTRSPSDEIIPGLSSDSCFNRYYDDSIIIDYYINRYR